MPPHDTKYRGDVKKSEKPYYKNKIVMKNSPVISLGVLSMLKTSFLRDTENLNNFDPDSVFWFGHFEIVLFNTPEQFVEEKEAMKVIF
jgi:hypothetical protein